MVLKELAWRPGRRPTSRFVVWSCLPLSFRLLKTGLGTWDLNLSPPQTLAPLGGVA